MENETSTNTEPVRSMTQSIAPSSEPASIGQAIGSIPLRGRRPASPEELASVATREQEVELNRRRTMWHDVSQKMGRRYVRCRMENFEVYGTEDQQRLQRAMLEDCRRLAERISHGVDADCGLVLFGPPGTGKDHLLAAMLFEACKSGRSVRWLNGLDFFGDMRDRIDRESPEAQVISDMAQPDILAISDPIPPWGPLTNFQAQTLFRVIDRRYRLEKPIWITVNVADGLEAQERIGAAAVDRIRQRSLCVLCNWPSYRTRKSGT